MKNMKRISALLCAAAGFSAMASGAQAETYAYTSVVTLRTATCDSFDSLAVGTTITGTIEIDVAPSSSFGDAEIAGFEFEVFNPALPVSGPVGDPVTDNPLLLGSETGIAASNGSAGTTDGSGELDGGEILVEFLVPPFSSNGAYVVFDLATGNGQVCLFYATAGCIPGATEAVQFEGTFALVVSAPDTDGDGITDDVDNCTLDANALQIDSNGDGIGNVCDADIAGVGGPGADDCTVNFFDLGRMK